MTACNNITVTQEVLDNKVRIEKMVKAYNSSEMLTSMYGKVEDINDNNSAVREMQEILKMQDESLRLDDAFILKDSQVKRFQNTVKQHDRQLNKPLTKLGSIFRIPNAAMRKTPATKRFQNNLDQAKSYERNKIAEQAIFMKEILKSIRKGYIELGMNSGFFNKLPVLKKIQKYENEVKYSEDPSFIFKTQQKIEKIVRSDKGGFIRDFNTLISLTPAEYKKAIKEGIRGQKYGRKIEEDQNRYGTAYNRHIVDAVDKGRQYLNKMGEVNIQALRFLREGLWLKNTNSEYNDTKASVMARDRILRSLDKNVEDAINRIKIGIKEGGYFPQILLDDVMKLKAKFNETMNESSFEGIKRKTEDLSENLQNMLKSDMPANVKSKNELLERRTSQNPFYILEQYGAQAIQFNKLNSIAKEYMRVTKALKDPKINIEYLKGLTDFVDDQFVISTKGLQNRPEWLNKTVRSINIFQTLKAMGFGLTGAVRNVASAGFFLSKIGLFNIKKHNNIYKNGTLKHDTDGAITYQALTDAVSRIQGFKFGDDLNIGQELAAEGVLTKEGTELLDFKYNLESGQIEVINKRSKNGYVSVNEFMLSNPVSKFFQNIPNRLLYFHQKGENITRNFMFKQAFVQAMEIYRSHPEYWSKHNGNSINMKKPMSNKMVKDAANTALFAVNQMAGEYALHSKSRLLTGSPGKVTIDGKIKNKIEVGLTSGTSMATALLHYPMFFADMQYKMVEGIGHSVAAKQWDSPEIKYAVNNAALTGFIAGISVLLNADLFRIFENDTIEKVKNLYRNIAGPDDDELNPDGSLKDNAKGYYGIIGDYTGPIVDDIIFGLQASNMMDIPDSELSRMFFGYDRLLESEDGAARDRAFWNRLGTFAGFMANKAIPSVRGNRGMDLVRHTFAAYPAPWIKNTKNWIGDDKELLGLNLPGIPFFKRRKVKGYGDYFLKNKKKNKRYDTGSYKLDQLMRDLDRK